MTKTIDEILLEIGEDKTQNLTTTSFKFKKDIWNFFTGFEDKNAVEFGTHKGQTTRVMSYLFNHVITFNLPGHFDEAELMNGDRDNITYVGVDLYRTDPDDPIPGVPPMSISVFFIDAGHKFDHVMSDVTRSINMKLAKGDIYFIFDDYGSDRDVYQAVNQLIFTRQMEQVQTIGHPPRFSFGGHPERVLFDYEGIITKLIK